MWLTKQLIAGRVAKSPCWSTRTDAVNPTTIWEVIQDSYSAWKIGVYYSDYSGS